jgi:hypothetical protein
MHGHRPLSRADELSGPRGFFGIRLAMDPAISGPAYIESLNRGIVNFAGMQLSTLLQT